MSEDDRAVMERLAALEAEVKADADAQRARKEAALAKVRAQRASQQAERAELSNRQAELVTRKPRRSDDLAGRDRDDADAEGLTGALELAKRAHGVKQELARTPKPGDKSWVKSGVASLLLGPIGWLYAGSLREAIPATAGWLALAAVASKILPMFLLMPVLMVLMPLSGIAGVVYALQYNRKGSRQRLFEGDKTKKPKQLPSG